MKISAESTDRLVTLQLPPEACGEMPARVWEATTDAGVPCLLLVTRVMVDKARATPAQQETFARELLEQRPPRVPLDAIPLRMIL